MTGPADHDATTVWQDACAAAAILAVDPAGAGGVLLRARAGPVRDRWLNLVEAALPPGAPFRRLPAHVRDDRLLGGLDLAATLKAGRPILARGVLAEADGGVVVAATAERLTADIAARLGAVLDCGEVVVERDGLADRCRSRFGLIALDEGAEPEETVVPALADRIAIHLDIGAVALRDAPDIPAMVGAAADARGRAVLVEAEESALEALCAAALVLGVASLRAPLAALRVARIAAAIAGRAAVDAEDLALAGRLVLVPRATRLPQQEPESSDRPSDPPPENQNNDADMEGEGEADLPDDMVVDAARAVIPADLLARLQAGQADRRRGGAGGKAGAEKNGAQRGRPAGIQMAAPHPGARPAVIDTLRAAAPWQRLRARGVPAADRPRVRVERQDFRYGRRRHRSETVTIFVVDASGSSAAQRLAEAKGAVELLLADCYVRRDQVAVLTFRRHGAEILLPPTRSLTRAKRALAGLPGGGGTPLAAGLEQAAALAEAERRRDRAPLVVLLTDGRANIARDGSVDRVRAGEDAAAAGRVLDALGVPSLLIDTGRRPDPRAATLADAMGATYLPLPFADAAAVSGAVRAVGDARP